MFSIEKATTKEKLNWKSPDFYKDNWSVFIFIPAGVGGSFQLLHLLSMDPSLVRFFSVEQVVPDGLLFIFLCLLGYLLFYGLKKAYMPKEKLNLDWNYKNIWDSVKRPLVLSLTMFFFLFLHQWGDERAFNNQPLIFNIFETSVLAIAIVLFLQFLFIFRILYYFRKFEDPKSELDNFKEHFEKIFKFYSLWGMAFYLFLFFGLVYLSMDRFLSLYQKTTSFNNLVNEKVLIDLVKTKMKIEEELFLKYYNGKYIFLEKETNGSSEFIVLKGESLVDLLKDEK